jgi:SAM-dependent methyltransferase
MNEIAEDERVRASYDRVPYPSVCHPEAQPDVLATLAFLYGMNPPPLASCRVLELGCASGANLIPAALRMPGARFVGIDLSPRQIEAGQRRIAELGLANIELRTVNLREAGAELGLFDSVIAHGLFSWVSAPVQEEVLRVCGECLAPDGVAYVSYNTLPGWHADLKLREMLQYHNRGRTDPREITDRSLDLVAFLADSTAGREDEHAQALRTARERLESFRNRPDYFLHDYLEDSNLPVYVHDFVERAARHGLQYLADAEPAANHTDDLPPEISGRLRDLAADRIALEQYTDFLRDRRFRRTLLCRQGSALDRTLVPRRMKSLWAATEVTLSSSSPDLTPGVPVSFRTPAGAAFSSTHALAKTALVHLAQAWPRALLFDDLLRGLRERRPPDSPSNPDDPKDAEVLADVLHTLFFAGVVRLHLLPPDCASTPGGRPRISPLARLQAAAGELITTQLYRTMEIEDEDTRRLLVHLDGEHDRAALAKAVGKEAGWVEGQLARLVEVGMVV